MNIKNLIENSTLDKNNIKFNESMKRYTSFKIGGTAECLINVLNKQELLKVLELAKCNEINITILGNCTNVLITDEGINGITLLIRIDENEIYIKEENGTIKLEIGAGMKLSKLGYFLLKNEISGFEELSGIPGTIGGAVVMNAGAYGKEMKDVLEYVKCVDYNGQEKVFEKKEMELEYRTSIFKDRGYIITEVGLCLTKGKYEKIKAKMDEYLQSRKDKQPLEYPNAGSTFKRGKDYITAKIIDECGLRGYTIGGAKVSEKHAGFIINSGEATARDVIELVEEIKKIVYEKTNKEIELEIEIVGKSQEVVKK